MQPPNSVEGRRAGRDAGRRPGDPGDEARRRHSCPTEPLPRALATHRGKVAAALWVFNLRGAVPKLS